MTIALFALAIAFLLSIVLLNWHRARHPRSSSHQIAALDGTLIAAFGVGILIAWAGCAFLEYLIP